MSSTQTVQSKWETMKPLAIALAIGLVAGPLISNYAGWQVTSRTARAETRDSVVEQLALICERHARADVADPGKLDWDARSQLAKKWVEAPAAPLADVDVSGACARKLSV